MYRFGLVFLRNQIYLCFASRSFVETFCGGRISIATVVLLGYLPHPVRRQLGSGAQLRPRRRGRRAVEVGHGLHLRVVLRLEEELALGEAELVVNGQHVRHPLLR